jgi:transcriptional regulator with PAS, ATPase and Fis domain
MENEAKSLCAEVRRIESLFSNRSAGAAKSALARIRICDRRRMLPGDKIAILQLQTKILLDLGKTKSAWITARHAMHISSNLDNPILLAATKLLLGKTLHRQGKTSDAEQEFIEAYVAFKAAGDVRNARIALSNIAHLQFYSGNLWRSAEVLRQGLAIDEIHKFTRFANQDRRNLCSVLVLLGRIREAEHVLAQVTDASTTIAGQANTDLRKAMITLFLLENENAMRHLKGAMKSFQELGVARMRDVCIEYSAIAHYNNGDYDEASTCCRQLLDNKDTTSSTIAQTLRILTDIQIATDKYNEALETADRAKDAISAINERIELGAIHRAYGQIYSAKGDEDEAREHFCRSIEILNETGARYELAMTYFARGKSACYSRDERIQSLETARSLFTEMEVTKRVDQVESYLHDLKCNVIRGAAAQQVDHHGPTVVAKSRKMKSTVSLCEQIAGTDVSVLLAGETGTGKDLLAQFIHFASRRTGEFVSVNAAAIPNDMIESELFGYAKGAYTGAGRDKPGLIERADEGTLYLNEISDSSPQLQAKLLEVLEYKRVRRLGEYRMRPVDFRLIAATNQDLNALLECGKFRLDLYYRLCEVPIHIPPLRERREDISPLVRFFIAQIIGNANHNGEGPLKTICALLADREWPGNVRELRAEIIRLWHLSSGSITQMLTALMSRTKKLSAEVLSSLLDETGWNQREAARRLGIAESTLRYRIRKLGWNRN